MPNLNSTRILIPSVRPNTMIATMNARIEGLASSGRILSAPAGEQQHRATADRTLQTSKPPRGKFRNVSSRRWRSSRLSRSRAGSVAPEPMVLQFLRPHHVLRPRDRCRTITPLLLVRVLPEPVHAERSNAEMSTIMHLARIPGKELPQEVPLKPIPVCPSPAVGDLHDAHSHPGFTRRQHSAHVENPPVPCEAFVPQQIVHALRRSHHTKVAGIAMRIARRLVVQRDRTRAWAGQRRGR